MPAAPLPLNEPERLQVLRHYAVLDSLPEPAFDGLTRIASQITGMPIALISLTDASRQWFKSRVGLDVPEIPRAWAPCAHVVAAGENILCEDMTRDRRFSDNPLVKGPPHLRCYAGFALITPRGPVLGSLALLDFRPRTLTAPQIESMEMLAQQIIAQLELRAAYRELAALRAEEKSFERRLLSEKMEEAQQLAAELHDGIGQDLAGISMLLSAIISHERDERADLVRSLEKIHLHLTEIVNLCRLTAERYGGFAVRKTGLTGALCQLASRLSTDGGPLVTVTGCDITPSTLDETTAYHLFRILQEAAVNARRHASAHTITISCRRGAHQLEFVVSDDGIGVSRGEQTSNGIGLSVMEYRAHAIGAELLVSRAAKGGTRVTCRLTLPSA